MNEDLKSVVREKYGKLAGQAHDSEKGSCCSTTCCTPTEEARNPITSDLYDEKQQASLPVAAVRASLGCGNPTALAELRPGEVVLDLGSGGGIDVLLSARRVGPTGKAYGLDMTDEMLELARRNQRDAGITNVEFLKGEIESIPLPDASVDVIISNCVINLSGDKDRVLAEAYRVLKPGGRFAVSDVVARGPIPQAIRQSMELWAGCIAGALEEAQYVSKLENAGFTGVNLEATRVYSAADARGLVSDQGPDIEQIASEVEGKFISAFIRATKPSSTIR